MDTNFVRVKERKGIIYHRGDMITDRYEFLEPGLYEIFDQGGMFQTLYTYNPIELKESLVRFTSGVISEILDRTESFFSADTVKAYKEMGISHKVGMIMYGPPGTGKTCTAQLAMKLLTEKYKCICLDGTGKSLAFILRSVENIRNHQDNPIVIFMDEVDESMRGQETEFLTFLDGNDSVSGCIFLGCTNYLDKIPRRIRNRRSRIRYTFEIKSLPKEVYEEYILSKIPNIPRKHLTEFSYLAEEKSLTIDELKHAVVDYHIDRVSIKNAINDVKAYSKQDDWDKDDDY